MKKTLSSPPTDDKRALLKELLKRRLAEGLSRHPASAGQQALWYEHHLAEGHQQLYNIPFAVHLEPSSSIDAIKICCEKLIRRHATLRTSFEAQGDGLMQVIHDKVQADFGLIDCSSREEVERGLSEAARTPFDLGAPPLLRVRVYHNSKQGELLLLFVVHHIVADYWSLELILADFLRCYEAVIGGEKEPTLSSEVSYVDFVRWQQEMLNSPIGEEHARFWTEALRDAAPNVELGLEKRRPATRTFAGSSIRFDIGHQLFSRIVDLGIRTNSTPFVLMLTALFVLIRRYSGQADITLGTTTAGRTRPEYASVVGYFVNPVPIRALVDERRTFEELVSVVRTQVAEAIEHQDLPLPLILQRSTFRHDSSRPPLFGISFSLERLGSGEKELQQSRAKNFIRETVALPAQLGVYDLEFNLQNDMERVSGEVRFNTDVFNAAAVEQVVRHYKQLLQSVVTREHVPVYQLQIQSDEERHYLCSRLNDTQTDYSPNVRVEEMFRAIAARHRDRVALTAGTESLSYAELDERSDVLASYLSSLGVGAESAVGLFLERSLEMVVGLLGILKAGGAYVPFDPEHPSERIKFMLEDSCVPILLTQQHLVGQLPENYRGCIIRLDTEWISIYAGWSAARPEVPAGLDNAAYVIYTSGSTGRPKGVVSTQQGLINRLLWQKAAIGMELDDCVLQKTPYTFDVSVWEFFLPLLVGARLVLARPGGHRDPSYLSALIEREQVTTIHFVPSMMQAFLEAGDLNRCKSLKRVVCSGEALSAETTRQFFADFTAELHNLYGPTEASIDVSHWQCSRAVSSVPIGKPIANTQLYILDEYLQVLPQGAAGELFIGGVNLARGYLNRPSLTAERFVPDAFSGRSGDRLYKTGDRARHLADGDIDYQGRLDDQVKIRGFRIELGEIENVLSQHPSVRQAAVIVSAVANSPALVAYFTSNSEVSVSEFRRYLAMRLPEYMVPSSFVPLEELPLTSSGKVDRKALPSAHPALVDNNSFVKPKGHMEETLAALWSEVLGLERVGANDDFFALGGTSLSALRLCNSIQQRLERKVSIGFFLQHRTIRKFAEGLHNASEDSHLVVIRSSTESSRVLYALHAAGGEVTPYEALARLIEPGAIPIIGVQADASLEPESLDELARRYAEKILSTRPSGVGLVGWSMGGVLALAVARYLEATGQRVDFVMLWDSYRVEADEHADVDRIESLAILLARLFSQQELEELDVEDLRGDLQGSMREDLMTALNWLQRRGKRLELEVPQLLKQLAQIDRHLRLFRQHRPKPIQAPLYHVRATRNPPRAGLTNDWGSYSKTRVLVHDVEANHFSIMDAQHIAELALHLNGILEQAQ